MLCFAKLEDKKHTQTEVLPEMLKNKNQIHTPPGLALPCFEQPGPACRVAQ